MGLQTSQLMRKVQTAHCSSASPLEILMFGPITNATPQAWQRRGVANCQVAARLALVHATNNPSAVLSSDYCVTVQLLVTVRLLVSHTKLVKSCPYKTWCMGKSLRVCSMKLIGNDILQDRLLPVLHGACVNSDQRVAACLT